MSRLKEDRCLVENKQVNIKKANTLLAGKNFKVPKLIYICFLYYRPAMHASVLHAATGPDIFLLIFRLHARWASWLPVISSHGRLVTVISSHPSYLIKGVLGVQHFIITMITLWDNHQSNCRDCLHVLITGTRILDENQ